ncbi:MAG: hypothetical protein HYU36_07325 [Planctomycetes bacterium]|nr:hypothetical protein [Planctomycetota bacterium]
MKKGKNDPIYNAHSYHTKVPPRAIIPYILHYTEPGDIVLDPFCGSGMTGVAAMLCENPPENLVQLVQRQNPGREIKKGARWAMMSSSTSISPAPPENPPSSPLRIMGSLSTWSWRPCRSTSAPSRTASRRIPCEPGNGRWPRDFERGRQARGPTGSY